MTSKEKILYIVEAMGGGIFTYIVDLANELVESYNIYIAYAVRKQTPSDYINYFDKRIHLIKVENFIRSVGLNDLKASFEIKKIAEKVKPDIIHLHSSKAGALGRWIFNGKKIPVFYTPHGYSFLMSSHSKGKRAIYKFIEMISAKRTCTTISCSEGEHQETLKLTNDALYVNNGINTKKLDRMINLADRIEHSFTVFTLGRICYQKNPRMFNKIAEVMPNVKFLWIGDGELKNELVAKNIKITGWVDRKTAIQYAVNADVFLLTSLWEGLPMSLLEAMYMKKLCVVSDVIGNRDVIQNSKNGYVCKNVDEFVNGIMGDVKLVEKARADIEKQYNTIVMAKKYNEIYQTTLRKYKDERYSI